MVTTFLYRFFGADDRLLYVGLTSNIPHRFEKHRREKPWLEVKRITVGDYPSREEALEAERVAITTEKPLWNVVHNGSRPRLPTQEDESPGISSFVGHFFHSFEEQEDGCQLVAWQGEVLKRVEPGFYLVQLFDWVIGAPGDRKVVNVDDMRSWAFYSDQDSFLEAYNDRLSFRSDDHFRHKTKKPTPDELAEMEEEG